MVVEHLHIERAIDIETAVAGDGIAQRDTIVALRTAYPGIAPRIRGITIHPVEDGQFVQRQLIAGGDLLLVVERCAEVLDALPY